MSEQGVENWKNVTGFEFIPVVGSQKMSARMTMASCTFRRN